MISDGRRSPLAIHETSLATETHMSANVTEELAGFTASLQYENIPERVRENCKNLLLDTLACAVAGHRGEGTRQAPTPPSAPEHTNQSNVIAGARPPLTSATHLKA